MEQQNILRTTKIGGGFVKEDVLAYVDELNSQIYALQETLRLRMKYPEKDIVHTLAEIQKSFFEDERF